MGTYIITVPELKHFILFWDYDVFIISPVIVDVESLLGRKQLRSYREQVINNRLCSVKGGYILVNNNLIMEREHAELEKCPNV